MTLLIHFLPMNQMFEKRSGVDVVCPVRYPSPAKGASSPPLLRSAAPRFLSSIISSAMTDSKVPQPGPAKLKRNAGPDQWLEAAKDCKYLSEAHMKQLCEMVKEYMMEGKASPFPAWTLDIRLGTNYAL